MIIKHDFEPGHDPEPLPGQKARAWPNKISGNMGMSLGSLIMIEGQKHELKDDSDPL